MKIADLSEFKTKMLPKEYENYVTTSKTMT